MMIKMYSKRNTHVNKKTTLMRVPVIFHSTVNRLRKKYGYKHSTDYLDNEGVRLFENSEALTDLVDIFKKRRRKL